MIYLVIYTIIIHSNLYPSGSRLLQCNVDYATSYINTYRRLHMLVPNVAQINSKQSTLQPLYCTVHH